MASRGQKTTFRLGSSGKSTSQVQAWTNPSYETTTVRAGAPGDAAITVKPVGDADLTEAMFPTSDSMLRRMSYQFWAVIFLIVAHAIVIAYTDPIYTRTPLVQVIVYSGQIGLLIGIVMAFFVLTSQTLFIQLGRYDLYLREFVFFYAFFAVELVLYAAVKIYATVLLLRRVSYLAMWDMPVYAPLWYIQRVVLLLFWAAAAWSATAVFDERYFDPDMLMGLAEEVETGRGLWRRKPAGRTQQQQRRTGGSGAGGRG